MRPLKSGLSPREILLGRSWPDNTQIRIDDNHIAEALGKSREIQNAHHQKHLAKQGRVKIEGEELDFNVGDLVFLRVAPDKHKARDMFTVVKIDHELLEIKKTENQFRSKSIKVRPQEVIKAQVPSNENVKEEDENEEDGEEPEKKERILKENVEILKNSPKTKEESRPRRKAAENSRVKSREMLQGMLRRILSTESKYSWVYFKGMEDEQFDIIMIPNDHDEPLIPHGLFDESRSDHSFELDEHPDNRNLTDDTTGGQHTQHPLPNPDFQPVSFRNSGNNEFVIPSSKVQSKKTKRRGNTSKPRSSSLEVSASQKRGASSPKMHENPKVRKSPRHNSVSSYYQMEHRYDGCF